MEKRGLDSGLGLVGARMRKCFRFPDRSFDAYTIAFGIRNVTHIDKALAGGAPRAQARRAVFLPRILDDRSGRALPRKPMISYSHRLLSRNWARLISGG
jgi:hypothetical protein